MPETFLIPHARTMLGGRRPPSGLGIKGERREAKVFRMAKSGRDVKQRLFKIEKRNTALQYNFGIGWNHLRQSHAGAF